jgi:hypothetical protein
MVLKETPAVFFCGRHGKLQTTNGARAFAVDAAQPQLKRVGELFDRKNLGGPEPNDERR